MTKSKRQLRAEAVERLKGYMPDLDEGEDDISECLGLLDCLTYMSDVDEPWTATRDALIDLLSDDELPEDDAVNLLREYATSEQSHDDPEHVMLERKVFDKLADMVERDYVRRIDFEAQHSELKDAAYRAIRDLKYYRDDNEGLHRANERLIAERDEWKTKCDTREVAYKQADAERKRYSEQIVELIIERDEWKAKAEEMQADADNIGSVCDKLRLEMGDLRHENVELSRENIELLMRVNKLAAERDEWKARAEQAERNSPSSGILYGREQIDALQAKWKAKAEGQSKVRAGSSNLEWLWENDPDFIADWVSKASYCRYCAFWDGCDGSMGADDPKCYRGNREWLMSEHVDAKQDSNGTCPDGNGTASESLSDESRTIADTSEKEPDCVREGAGMSANADKAYAASYELGKRIGEAAVDLIKRRGVSENLGSDRGTSEPETSTVAEVMPRDNDGKTASNPRQDDGMDTREKLEADLEKLTREWHDYDGNFMRIYGSVAYAQVKELLDRQAAITERELCKQCDWPSLAAQPDQEAYDRIAELERENATLMAAHADDVERLDAMGEGELQKRIEELEAERDRLRFGATFSGAAWEAYTDLQAKVDELTEERDKLSKHCENQRKALKQANDQIRRYKHALESDEDVLYNGGGAKDWYGQFEEQAALVEGLERRNVALADEVRELRAQIALEEESDGGLA